ncbi:pantothenate transporter liz1 [Naematelia encephala]|uniref:Pantothenate transporter liz1 n=1 Tax=Naematelia encephala TaxID=71784 RepID=A0A1Y2AX02_9TREE|nr:pantothenate transporter liz1 [Naematelia encephala]
MSQDSQAFISANVVTSDTTDTQQLKAVNNSTLSVWQRLVVTVWDSDHYAKTSEERVLVRKLDCTLLICLAFGYFMKNIDQGNLSNAYVSGLQVDLNITGNQYTYMGTIYNVVYCVMQVPSNLIVLKVRPSWWLAGCEIGWTIFTFAQAGAQTYQHMYVFRFFIGFFEASFQSLAFYVLGSWYTKSELAKRTSIFYIASPLGQAFASYAMAAVYTSMDRLAGLAGWRWLYIICGIMSAPVAVSVFFLVPDFPETTKAWYLTEQEKEIGRLRAARNGTVFMTGIVNFSTFKKIVSQWRFWTLLPAYLFYATGVQSYNYFGVYLRSAGYSVAMRNILPGCAFVLQIPLALLYGYIADKTGSRFLVCFVPMVLMLFPTIVLAVWPDDNTLRVTAFMLAACFFITHIFFTWVNEIAHASMEERGFLIAACQCFFYAFNAFLPAIVFRQTDGPTFRKGFPTVLGANILACIAFVTIYILHQRQLRQEAAQSHAEEARDQEQSPISGKDDDKDALEKVTILRV